MIAKPIISNQALVWAGLVFAIVAAGICDAHAQTSGNESLAIAQKRLTMAIKELDQAKAQARRKEKQLKDTEAAVARLQTKLDEEKAKLEQTRKELVDAQANADQAQQRHDEVNAEIQRFYRERQPSTSPSKP